MTIIAETDRAAGEAAEDDRAGAGGTLLVHARTILRNAILDGRLVAGQRLRERELVLMTGASRSVLREALVHLEANKLIEREAYKGFRVARLGSRKIVEIFELRSSLEAQAAELFTERASEEELDELRAALAEIERLQTAFSADGLRRAKERYYDVVFNGCRNVEIRNAMAAVMDRIHYLRGRLIADPGRRKRSVEEMRRLTGALVARDRLGAREATVAHLVAARDAVLQLLREDAAGQPPGSEGEAA